MCFQPLFRTPFRPGGGGGIPVLYVSQIIRRGLLQQTWITVGPLVPNKVVVLLAP